MRVDKYESMWQKRRARLESLDKNQPIQNTIFTMGENVLDNLRRLEVQRRAVPMSLTHLQEAVDWHKCLTLEWESMELACKGKSWLPVKHLEKGRLSGSDRRQAKALEKAEQEGKRGNRSYNSSYSSGNASNRKTSVATSLVTAMYMGNRLKVITSTMTFSVGEANIVARLVPLRMPCLRIP